MKHMAQEASLPAKPRDPGTPHADERPAVDVSKVPYQLPQPSGVIADSDRKARRFMR